MTTNTTILISGMHCANCALSVKKYMSKIGFEDTNVNFITGELVFNADSTTNLNQIKKGINSLGYGIVDETKVDQQKNSFLNTPIQKAIFCLPFCMALMLHMLPFVHLHWLMNGYVQFFICLPVFVIGLLHFGKPAINGLKNKMPNMQLLICFGASIAFLFSVLATIFNWGSEYFFYETTGTIITLVFVGEMLESLSMKMVQKELSFLKKNEVVSTTMIAFNDKHQEEYFTVNANNLKVGDLVLIKTGEQVPTDCKILSGNGWVDEKIITGENKPVQKQNKDLLIGGSLIQDGLFKCQITTVGKDTIMAGILRLTQNAQANKPKIQKLADKISAIFIPTVIALAIVAFLINFFLLKVQLPTSIIRSIAVLIIACPCAMGIATPAAAAVGLSKALKNGVLINNINCLENFNVIDTIVFDKTGTLTTGEMKITNYSFWNVMEEEFKSVIYNLEKNSTHPIAKSICKQWKGQNNFLLNNVYEIKGVGISGNDKLGNKWMLGSYKLLSADEDGSHDIYLLKNNEIVGWIDIEQEIRAESKSVIEFFNSKNINTIILSGDKQNKCDEIAKALGIKNVYAQQSPNDKLEFIKELSKSKNIAMIGDGVNDAAALAQANVGISLSNAAQITLQNSDIVLVNEGLNKLPYTFILGKEIYKTIKQNLAWAFIYNIIAIPFAAIGLIKVQLAAIAMGISDVALAINSIALKFKKINYKSN